MERRKSRVTERQSYEQIEKGRRQRGRERDRDSDKRTYRRIDGDIERVTERQCHGQKEKGRPQRDKQ
jgi:hypothetical protein